MKMKSLAENYEQMAVTPERQPHYPSLFLRGEQIPDYLSGSKVGQEVTICVKARIAGVSERVGGQKELTLEMVKIGCEDEGEESEDMETDE